MKLYSQKDVDKKALKGAKICVLGYGSQGRAHALNLKDSGFDVVIGVRKGDSWKKAKKDGLPVAEPAKAVIGADLVAMLAPDLAQKALYEAVVGNLKQGATQIKIAIGGGVYSLYDPLDVTEFTEDEIRAAVDAASDWGTYVTAHVYTPKGVLRGIRNGLKTIEHGQLMDEETARELGLPVKMRLVSYSFVGVEPEVMGAGPIPATEKALKQAGLTIDDIGAFEVNEAFAVQVLAFLEHFGIADDDPRVNPYGGAIAMGHPLASSGVRLMTQLARAFEEHPEVRYGLTTMCIGIGMGGTVIWENPHWVSTSSTTEGDA